MSAPPPHEDIYAEGLARLFTLSMALAEHAQAHALASDDPAVIGSMGGVFAKAARSARQTAALAQRHAADQARIDREAAVAADKERQVAIRVRRDHLCAVLWPEVCHEVEARDDDEISDAFDYALKLEALSPTFTIDAIDAQLDRLREQLGLGPDDDEDGDDEEGESRDEDDDPPTGRSLVQAGGPHTPPPHARDDWTSA